MDKERKSGWLLGMMALVLAGVIGFGLVYVNRQVAASEQRDCETLRADIEAIEEAPVLTPAGQRVTQSRRERYAQIGCEPALKPARPVTVVPSPRLSR